MLTNSCRVSRGRLLELRVFGFETPAAVDAFADLVQDQLIELSSSPGASVAGSPAEPPASAFGSQPEPPALASSPQRAVLVADWRGCPVLTPPVAERVLAMLRRNSPLIERNALLHLPDQSTSLLQLFRVIQEAENPHRRLFTDVGALERFLGELLDGGEQLRLRSFLTESPLSKSA
jgi:hypothetical protein